MGRPLVLFMIHAIISPAASYTVVPIYPEQLNAIDTSPYARMDQLDRLFPDRVFPKFEQLRPRIQIQISDLEHVYPWLLCITNGIDPRDVLPTPSLNTQVTRTGSLLHDADALFSMITRRVDPLYIKRMAPGLKGNQQHAIMQALTEVRNLHTTDLITRLTKGWEVFFESSQSSLSQAQTLFDFFRTTSTSGETMIDEVHTMSLKLAHAWVGAVNETGDVWEYSPNVTMYREVPAVVPMNLGLVIKARLDSVAAMQRKDSTSLQIIDLKTGRIPEGELAIEIARHQGRLMELAATIILPKIQNFKPLEKDISGRPLALKFDFKKLNPIRFGYRYFDRTSGEMNVVFLDDSRKERREFYDWLKWFSIMMHQHYHEYKLWHKTHG